MPLVELKKFLNNQRFNISVTLAKLLFINVNSSLHHYFIVRLANRATCSSHSYCRERFMLKYLSVSRGAVDRPTGRQKQPYGKLDLEIICNPIQNREGACGPGRRQLTYTYTLHPTPTTQSSFLCAPCDSDLSLRALECLSVFLFHRNKQPTTKQVTSTFPACFIKKLVIQNVCENLNNEVYSTCSEEQLMKSCRRLALIGPSITK